MNSELLDLTLHLEEKLKVPAEKLLEILGQQVKVEIFQNSLITAASIAATVVGFKLLKRVIAKNEDSFYPEDEFFFWIMGGVMLLVPVAFAVGGALSLITGLLNPEYAALKLILK